METGLLAVAILAGAVVVIVMGAKDIKERYMHDFRRGISTKGGRLHPNQYDRTGEFRAYVAAEEAALAAFLRETQEGRRKDAGSPGKTREPGIDPNPSPCESSGARERRTAYQSYDSE